MHDFDTAAYQKRLRLSRGRDTWNDRHMLNSRVNVINIWSLQEMSTTRPQRAKRNPNQDAIYYSSLGKDKDGFDIKYIDSVKGDFFFLPLRGTALPLVLLLGAQVLSYLFHFVPPIHKLQGGLTANRENV